MDAQPATYPPATRPDSPGQACPPVATKVRPAPKGWGKLFASFGLGIAAFLVLAIIEVAGSIAGQFAEIDANMLLMVAEMGGGLAALLFVVALGGKRIARPSLKGMGEAWRAAIWLFVADGIFVVAEIAEVALGIEPFELAADWPARTAVLALLCLGVGLVEECTMRGLCLNGLLARMGGSRAGVYAAVILSSFAFGMLHFDPLVGFDDPLQVAQNCLKVVQAGMCGFLLAAILVKTRNIWTVICIHAANDFMLLVMTSGLASGDVSTDYVQSGDDCTALIMLYCILILLYLPFLFVGKRLVDSASPWRGDFYHYQGASRAAERGAERPGESVPVYGAVPRAEPVYSPRPTETHIPPMAGAPTVPFPDPQPTAGRAPTMQATADESATWGRHIRTAAASTANALEGNTVAADNRAVHGKHARIAQSAHPAHTIDQTHKESL